MKYTSDHYVYCPTKEIAEKVLDKLLDSGYELNKERFLRQVDRNGEKGICYWLGKSTGYGGLNYAKTYMINKKVNDKLAYTEVKLEDFLGKVHENNYEIY